MTTTKQGNRFRTWVNWIEGWPWSKSVILIGILTFLGCQFALVVSAVIYSVFPSIRPPQTDAWLVQQWMTGYDEVLQASLWAMGIGGSVLGIKRATTKADVIEAETKAGSRMTATGRETEEHPVVDETRDGGKGGSDASR